MNDFDPITYENAHAYVIEYGQELLSVLDPAPGERILDIGCGTGHITADIADAVGSEGAVVGLDVSIEMVERARTAHPHLEIRHADATDFCSSDPFDAVYSNAALHWIDDQDALLKSVTDALRPGGRFVGEMGAVGNIFEILDALETVAGKNGIEATIPWYFPTLGSYTSKLEEHGFEVSLSRTFERPTTLEGENGLQEWLEQFGEEALSPFSDRAETVAALEDELRDECYNEEDEKWTVTYRRLQFRAIKLSNHTKHRSRSD
jgi:trans-aconitate methyltransferase